MTWKIQFTVFTISLFLLSSAASGAADREFRVDINYRHNQDVVDSLDLIEKNGDVRDIDISPTGKFVVYSRSENMPNESRKLHIWLLELDTLTKTDLLHNNDSHASPVFLDEFTIAFGRIGIENDTIWTLDIRTKELKQIIPQDGFVARGPQGKILFYPTPTGVQNLSPLVPYNIWLLNRDGGNPVQLTSRSHPNSGKDFIHCCPSLGLNDTKLIFLQGDGVWAMDLDGKNRSKIINESASVSDFSTSRTGIVFRSPSENIIWFVDNIAELKGEIVRGDLLKLQSIPGLKSLGGFSPEPLDYILAPDGSALFFVGMTPEGKQGIYMLKLKNISLQSTPFPPSPYPVSVPPSTSRQTPGFEGPLAIAVLIGGLILISSRRRFCKPKS